jgi:hypothetical protein
MSIQVATIPNSNVGYHAIQEEMERECRGQVLDVTNLVSGIDVQCRGM